MQSSITFAEAVALGLPEIHFTNTAFLNSLPDGSCEGCLIGGALWATGIRKQSFAIVTLMTERWPWTTDWAWTQGAFPCGCDMWLTNAMHDGRVPLHALITHLASHYQNGTLSLPRICDLIREIETKATAAQANETFVSQSAEAAAAVRA